MEALLSRNPGLAHEFRAHYGPLDRKDFKATNAAIENISTMPRTDSNDTMISHSGVIPSFPLNRALAFSPSVPAASAAATTITPSATTITPYNYIESNEREPLLGGSHRSGVNSRVESQINNGLDRKKYSPVALALLYFLIFLILFIGALIATFYFGLLDLSKKIGFFS